MNRFMSLLSAFFLLIFSFLVVGCSTVENVQGAGPNVYFVRCSRFSSHKHACYQRAAKLCPRGYRVLENATPLEGLEAYDGLESFVVRSQTIVGITVKCK